VALNGVYAGNILIRDELREDSRSTVAGLKKKNIRQYMLTGDNEKHARFVAGELGIDEVYFQLLPPEKVTRLEEIMRGDKKGGHTVYVGDGINDAPVLARADIGVALGGLGSDAAIQAADVVLMQDRPEKLLLAIHIAQKTRNVVWQNISLAFGIKFIVLGLGAVGMATMWEAVFADVGVALLAVLNSSRLPLFSGEKAGEGKTAPWPA
jgi:Cd2+/Zn2+-exporting ATPase